MMMICTPNTLYYLNITFSIYAVLFSLKFGLFGNKIIHKHQNNAIMINITKIEKNKWVEISIFKY